MLYLYILIGVLTLFRLIVAAHVGLGDVEAYYWTWSQHLAPSYYDHGPVVAWSILLGTALLGDTPLGVRAVFIVFGALLLLTLAVVTKKLYGPKQALIATAALLSMPMVLIAGGAANPDVPFTLLVMLFVRAALRTSGTDALWRVLLLGLLAGLATSTKLFGLALMVPLFLLAWRHPRRRSALFTASLSLLMGVFPLLWWNLQHNWASLRYHLVARHGADYVGPSIVNLLKLLGGQLAYVGPITAVAIIATAITIWRRDRDEDLPHAWLLMATALPLLAGGMLLILIVPNAEPHWPAAGYLPLLPLLGAAVVRRWSKRWVRAASTTALVIGGLVFALFHLHVMTDLGVRAAPKSYVPRYDISNELYGWPQVASVVQHALKAHQDPRSTARSVAAAACHYTSCSQLRFAARGRFEVLCPSPRMSQYDFFPGGDGSARRGIDLLYVRDERFPFDAATLYQCAEVQPAQALRLIRAGRVVRRFELQWCLDFQGLRATRWPPQVQP